MNALTLTLPAAMDRAAIALREGRPAETEQLCRAVLGTQPTSFDAQYLLARALAQRAQQRDALLAVDKALALQPDHVEAQFVRVDLLRRLNLRPYALAAYGKILALQPRSVEALHDRAALLREMNRLGAALADCDAGLAIRPDYAEMHYLRGVVLRSLNRWRDAVDSFARAVALRPDYSAARFGRCIAELPILYSSEAEIAARRAGYEQALRRLCDDFASGGLPELASGIGSFQPFFLAYQGLNDRAPQSLYGTLLCRLAERKFGQAAVAPPPRPGEPIRVGIVSGFFRMHSNWKQPISGWLKQLDRSRFDVFGYHAGAQTDDLTKVAAAACRRFVQGPLPPERWREEILRDAPHVLVYPEIGMNGNIPALAAQRLARTQCSFWGHPETSGMPTIDYFLSSELMEPPDGQSHYTERLVRLPNLSIYYEPVDLPRVAVDRAKYKLRPGATVFWCSQSVFKYLPQFDDVFARIAQAAGDCQFVFIQTATQQHVAALFWMRLAQAFARHGFKIDDHCVLLQHLPMPEFVAAMGLCDVFLDSIGWSGGNTTLESLTQDLPIVTLPGPVMRSRHSAAILRQMGITETIAATVDDYVSLAVRLARDVPWRRAMKAKVAANKHRVYRDRAAIEGFEQFLETVARA